MKKPSKSNWSPKKLWTKMFDRKNRKLLFTVVVALAVITIGAALVLRPLYIHKQQPTVAVPATQPDQENTILVESDPTGIDVDLSPSCSSSTKNTPFTCKVDSSQTATITAPAQQLVNDQQFVFTTWDGCSESNSDKKICTVRTEKGSAVKIKASYITKQQADAAQATSQSGQPYLETKLASFSSVHFPGEVPTISTGGAKTINKNFEIITKNLDLNSCQAIHNTVLDDGGGSQAENLQALTSQQVTLHDGTYTITVKCTSGGKNYEVTLKGRVADGQPKLCKDFSFTNGAPSVSDIDELKAGIVGHWQGCVYTPWVPPYNITMDINADGTYQAVTSEALDGVAMNAMYYGTQEPNPNKKYYLDYFQNGYGTGQIDISFGGPSTNRGSLNNIKLTDSNSKLNFEFFHRSEYGPLNFKLYRQ